jgi:1-acyl-sn-glycerol-3-phosphate acyltransferase
MCEERQTRRRSRAESQPRSETIAWTVGPLLVRGVGKVIWRLETDLGNGVPDPPYVVASNHFSFLDPVLLGAVLRQRIRFLALVDLFGNHRWLDFALTAFEVIPIRRGMVPLGPVRAALCHLSDGGVVGLFPEGTRHRSFEPDRARPGAAWLAARTSVPLVPVAIAGTDEVLGLDNRLHSGRIRVEVGPPLHARGTDRVAVEDLTSRWGRWVSEALNEG